MNGGNKNPIVQKLNRVKKSLAPWLFAPSCHIFTFRSTLVPNHGSHCMSHTWKAANKSFTGPVRSKRSINRVGSHKNKNTKMYGRFDHGRGANMTTSPQHPAIESIYPERRLEPGGVLFPPLVNWKQGDSVNSTAR